jgi:tetratricopeptide (TPR) repeat protein
VIRYRSVIALGAVALLAGALALGGPQGAVAAPKPTPSPSAAPVPSPTATPETLDKQIPRLEAQIKSNPDDKEAAAQLAGDYLQVQRPDLAIGMTQKLIAGGIKTAQVYFIDGSAQAQLGHQTEAIASMEQASNLEPTNMLILSTLTQYYIRANRNDDAERVAKRALTFNPNVKDAYMNLGFVYDSEKKYDDARTQFEAAAKLDPKDPHPVVIEARTYMEQNAPALAMQLVDRAIAIDPHGIEALIAKAEIATSQHDLTTALATYNTILGLQTDDIDKAAVMVEIAKAYATEKQDANADDAFKKAIAAYPAVLQTHLVYGDYLMSRNDKAGALREWTAGLGPNRDSPDALLRLGNYYASANDFPHAIENYKRLTEVVPNDPRGYLALGQANLASKQWNDAANAFKASYNLAHTPDALLGLAAADLQLRNFNESTAIYEALDKNAPELVKANPGILYNLGKSYQGQNQPAKAKVAYTRLLSYLKPNTQAYTQVHSLIASLGGGGGVSQAPPKPAPTKSPAPHH